MDERPRIVDGRRYWARPYFALLPCCTCQGANIEQACTCPPLRRTARYTCPWPLNPYIELGA